MEGYAELYSYGATVQENQRPVHIANNMVAKAKTAAKNQAAKVKKAVVGLRDGNLSIKILSYIAGVLLVATNLMSLIGNFFTLHPIDAVIDAYMVLFGLTILLLSAKMKFVSKSFVAGLHKYCAFTTVVWGRGCFLIFIGTLTLGHWGMVNIVVGTYVFLLGIGMIIWGKGAYIGLNTLMEEMKDPNVVAAMFVQFDSNENGFLDAKEFAKLIKSLGAPLTPTEIEAAMIIIDSDNDERISLPEFQAWWAQRSELPNLPGII